ncbi:MAG TPA: molybdate ABC transporter substrate-binding protein [Alphaproteobacteria bacterium]|nr:molybdate ABC transporter substrate-binding protein [Alphaproteobacteria bacterium]
MKLKKTLNILILLIFTGVLSATLTTSDAKAKPKRKQAFDRGLIVYAPTSLTNVLHQILKEFSIKENISVSSSFDSSLSLEEKVEEGLPVNVFITEDNFIMKDLQQKGLINVYSFSQIASDKLVIVAPKGNYMIKKLAKYDTTKDKLRFISEKRLLVVPDIQTEKSGKLTQKIFEEAGLWEKMKKSLITVANSREALYLASNGENLAVVYASDAASESSVEVVVDMPELFNDKIIYQAVIVADLGNTGSNQDAQRFIDFLRSETSKKILKSHGLKPI